VTQQFENVEAEWPMFYSFLIIDGVFRGINDQVEKYQKFLKRRLIYTEKGGTSVYNVLIIFSKYFRRKKLPKIGVFYLKKNNVMTIFA
jgi:hypothetical protein